MKLYGSCFNALVACCVLHILWQFLEYKLFVLVGDLYRVEDESTEQLTKVYSDTELGKDGKKWAGID